MEERDLNRCRLALAVSRETCSLEDLSRALSASDVACVLLHAGKDLASFSGFAGECVPIIQRKGVAALICDDTQLAGRSEADGIYLEKGLRDLSDVIARFSPHKSVGCGGIMTRHSALEIGELNPDFMLFGKLGGDIKPEPHPKNLLLGNWWSEFVEIPGMTLAGTDIESVVEVAKSGVDFVLAEQAVFNSTMPADAAVARINQLLEDHAPRFVEA